MKSTALVLCMAAAVAAHAQTAAKPAATAAKSTAATHAAAAPASTASAVKYPAGITPVPGVPKTAFSLRYQDIKVGTGADAVPMKMYKVKYTGWRAADGVIFDSWDQHPMPELDKDGKQVMGDDGKPKMGAPEPASFPVGMGRMIPGFDQGFTGMKVGGKRRLFIPWQLAYGTRAMPDRGPDHPGIPAKSDLVFDVELVDIADLPMPQNHPGAPGAPTGAPPSPGAAPRPATPPSGASGAPSTPSTPPPAGAPSTPSQASTPPSSH